MNEGEQTVLLRCPRCGAATLYIAGPEDSVFFRVTEDGRPVDLWPEDAHIVLDDDTLVCCAVCAWEGPTSELTASPQQ